MRLRKHLWESGLHRLRKRSRFSRFVGLGGDLLCGRFRVLGLQKRMLQARDLPLLLRRRSGMALSGFRSFQRSVAVLPLRSFLFVREVDAGSLVRYRCLRGVRAVGA